MGRLGGLLKIHLVINQSARVFSLSYFLKTCLAVSNPVYLCIALYTCVYLRIVLYSPVYLCIAVPTGKQRIYISLRNIIGNGSSTLCF